MPLWRIKIGRRPEFNFKFRFCPHCFCDYSSSFTPLVIQIKQSCLTFVRHFVCPRWILHEAGVNVNHFQFHRFALLISRFALPISLSALPISLFALVWN